MKTRTDAHDDVALRDEETITWWAMMHNMEDDRVPCSKDGCEQEAKWRHTCPGCKAVRFFCVPNIHVRAPFGSTIRHASKLGGCDQVFAWSTWNAAFIPM